MAEVVKKKQKPTNGEDALVTAGTVFVTGYGSTEDVYLAESNASGTSLTVTSLMSGYSCNTPAIPYGTTVGKLVSQTPYFRGQKLLRVYPAPMAKNMFRALFRSTPPVGKKKAAKETATKKGSGTKVAKGGEV